MLTRHEIKLFIASTVVLFVALMYSPWGTMPLFDSKGEVRDFAFLFSTVVGFLSHDVPGISTPSAIFASLTAVLGMIPPPDVGPMPNPLSPSAIIIWSPLLIPLRVSLNAAFCVWLAVSLGLLTVLIGRLWKEAVPNGLFERMIFLAIIFAVLTSAAGRTCFDIGQTTFFALALLGIISRTLRASFHRPSEDWCLGALLFLLSIKIQYAVLGAGMLGIERRWRALSTGLLLTMISILAVDPLGTHGLISDFFRMMIRYSSGDMARNGFYWGGFGSNTPTWLTVTEGVLPDPLRHFVNTAAVIIGALSLVILFIRSKAIPTTKRLTAGSAIITGVYLCFSPYLGFYEQLLIIVPLIAGAEPELFRSRRGALVMLFGVMLSLSSLPLKGVVWASKVAVMGWMLTISRANR
jgi:hypothetical protein